MMFYGTPLNLVSVMLCKIMQKKSPNLSFLNFCETQGEHIYNLKNAEYASSFAKEVAGYSSSFVEVVCL
jgi:hypothetical protein